MEYIVAAYTDTGIGKANNQDSLCLRRVMVPNCGEAILAVICDGMGGLDKGELASATVIRSFEEWFERIVTSLPDICKDNFHDAREQLTEVIYLAHRKIKDFSLATHMQMGSTATAMLAFGSNYIALNVGDSRLYEFSRQLHQVTRDQSLVAREIEQHKITEEQARYHPQRNVLLQCIGLGDSVSPDFYYGDISGGKVYLLCTDGMTHEIPFEELSRELQITRFTDKRSITEKLMRLTDICKQRGEQDNITSLLLQARESQLHEQKRIFSFLKKKVMIDTSIRLLETATVVHTAEKI